MTPDHQSGGHLQEMFGRQASPPPMATTSTAARWAVPGGGRRDDDFWWRLYACDAPAEAGSVSSLCRLWLRPRRGLGCAAGRRRQPITHRATERTDTSTTNSDSNCDHDSRLQSSVGSSQHVGDRRTASWWRLCIYCQPASQPPQWCVAGAKRTRLAVCAYYHS